MLTLTAILVGLLLLGTFGRVCKTKMRDGSDVLSVLLGLAMIGVVVWQFYFRMLPLAWGGE